MSDKPNTRIITPRCILSFPHLFEPHKMEGDNKAKYSVCLVFPADTDLSGLEKVIMLAGRTKWPGGEFETMLRDKALKLPFRRDGVVAKGYPEGSMFFNARSDNAPGIVMPQAGADGKPIKLTDRALIYPGCWVRASLTAYGYSNRSKGVTFGLNNIQWLDNGTRLDSRKDASEDFDAVEVEPANLEDMEQPNLSEEDDLKSLLG
jgi:hypothetical protein